jgi:GNAT superfamily N-acetyltransferase
MRRKAHDPASMEYRMQHDDLNKANVDNLTALWKTMGVVQPSGIAPERLQISARWPHRCWLDWDARSEEIVALAEKLDGLPDGGIVPLWPWPDGGIEVLERTLVGHGFAVRSVLTAMVLDLETGSDTGTFDETTVRVTTQEEIETWTDVCSRGFGYTIDVDVIRRLSGSPDVALYLAHVGGMPAATALTLQTGDTVGLHQLGVPRCFRGQGVGSRTMNHVMAHCHASGSRYATLQASTAGEGIYRRIGFEPQFTIRNYQRSVAER